MLDQFRHDINADSNDALQDSRFQMSRRKFVYSLSGAALALVLFLFLIGAFRSEKSELEHDMGLLVSGEAHTDTTLKELQARITKLEDLVAKNTNFTRIIADTSSQIDSQMHTAELLASQIHDDLDASLTDDSLKQLIQQQQPLQPSAYPIPDNFSTNPSQPTPVNPSSPQPTPTPKPTPAAQVSAVRTYVVQKGDTLSKISQRFYGSTKRSKEIYNANREKISNMNQLKVGTKIVIPEDSK